jgi:hypothetical protein
LPDVIRTRAAADRYIGAGSLALSVAFFFAHAQSREQLHFPSLSQEQSLLPHAEHFMTYLLL